jgi:hypothetical protein
MTHLVLILQQRVTTYGGLVENNAFFHFSLEDINLFWLRQEHDYLCLIALCRSKVYSKLYFPLSHHGTVLYTEEHFLSNQFQ